MRLAVFGGGHRHVVPCGYRLVNAVANDGVNTDFERPGRIANTGAIERHFGNLFFDAGLTGLVPL